MLPNLGTGELILILAIVILLFGAKRLPELAKSIGKSVRALKAGLSETPPEEKPDTDSSKKA